MNTCMNYKDKNSWNIIEEKFDENYLGKTESIMCQGNGYIGIRAAAEESYIGEYRNCFVAGTYNKADKNETTELPNTADCIQMEIILDGQRFALNRGIVLAYEKKLSLKKGELERNIQWQSPDGKQYELSFKRFISLFDLHVIAQKITVKPLDADADICIRTGIDGIDGRMANLGAQHFEETEKRYYEKKYMQYVQTTTDSKIVFVWNTKVTIDIDGKQEECNPKLLMERRKVFGEYTFTAKKDSLAVIQKVSNVYTTRDKNYTMMPKKNIQEFSLEQLKYQSKIGYDSLLEDSKKAWKDYWERADIVITTNKTQEQLAIRFAQYHLRCMTPAHDERMSIGAKGLSGEGYKGHVFWDTDIFILPYYSMQFPEIAKKLIQYRVLGLSGARKKAEQNGYKGAQYPWEAAWIDDGEVTPDTGDVDIITGRPQVIWTGKIEQHITADVIYGLWQYYMISKDEELMQSGGFQMIFETAEFWASRLEMGQDWKYHINNVIGPDEYKEHVDDNAFTNYMVYWNFERAIESCKLLKEKNENKYKQLDEEMNLERKCDNWRYCMERLYLPLPDENARIPQDATYLTLKDIELEKYKKQDFVLGIYKDYNAEQINQIQVSKQADILLMFYLLENYFTQEVIAANWNYYEPRTLHDSSLSLSTHCILANDLGRTELAEELFEKLCNTDMGDYMKSSDAGVHAASLGGIWQAVVFGIAGIRIIDGQLRIRPHLFRGWEKLEFSIVWQGILYKICIGKTEVTIEKKTENDILQKIEICGKKINFKDKITVPYHA